ncbi:1-(5-phosphoribosyl)-5-[(5-phosphoribosylamino)methylideneamino]imidazole-4-carboxamide isomerase [Candidatus Bathyarchaeota archaeon]|nr:MAG: 1-(5-phosphoribosyl)-5-[(5-phosphoribosylamino)methylideneamino]imidazole-4-carboxamide isomerase [Candidatus Bathyarchaeota archaeon]
MEIMPAVDIMKGKVVRLLKGNPKQAKSYDHLGDPVSLARRWEREGARIIHIVDLDAALGLGSNIEMIGDVVKSVSVPVQAGGGIRSISLARRLFSIGVKRIIVGSLAFSDPSAIETLLREFGDERIAVALDHNRGIVMVGGWKRSAGISVEEAAERFREIGIKFFLVTSIHRDGTLLGPDLEVLSTLTSQGYRIIAAGGISCINDILALKDLGVYGVIVGRALYEGKISLSEALRVAGND